jgi:histidinol dehydrogenase
VVPSKAKAEEISGIAASLIEKLPEQRQDFIRTNFKERSCILWSGTLEKAIDFVNDFAPEHLGILTENPMDVMEKIENAGEIMVGEYSPITLGNFCAGSNAILPTGGLAKSRSCLGVQDFQKRTSYVHVNKQGFDALSPVAVTLAEYEGFPAHANAVRARNIKNTQG